MNSSESHYPKSRPQFRKLLEDNGLKATNQRLQLAELLLTEPQHLSADQVIAKLRDNGSNISKATVYNTLNLFADKGLLKELIIDGNRVFFDSNTSDHHHFFNEETSELIDFNTSALRIAELPEAPEGTVCTGVEVFVKIKKS